MGLPVIDKQAECLSINDHFQRDLRTFNGNMNAYSGTAANRFAPGFYQRAATATIVKKYNCSSPVSIYECDQWHPSAQTKRATRYDQADRATITKRSNYTKPIHMENDQWHGITSTRPIASNNFYESAEKKTITKKSNKSILAPMENDQWHPPMVQENVVYKRKSLATISKSYNMKMKEEKVQYENDQWQPMVQNNHAGKNNIKYKNFENKKAYKPWHNIQQQNEIVNSNAQPKKDDLISPENIDVSFSNINEIPVEKEWLDNIKRDRTLKTVGRTGSNGSLNKMVDAEKNIRKGYVIVGGKTKRKPSHLNNQQQSELQGH